MQVPRVRVERLNLLAYGFDNVRMTMPNVRHVVVHVEVFFAVGIVQPYALTPHEVNRLRIK